ncbi:hypothetical protein ACFL96_12745 [Thermoproteota archaeon]
MLKIDAKTRKYVTYVTISLVAIMLLSGSIMPMFQAQSPSQDPNAVPVELPEDPADSILNNDPTTSSHFIIRYADDTYKIVESLNLFLGIIDLSSIYNEMSVFNEGQEITAIDMGVDMIINFKGEPTPFEVYKNIVLQINNSDGFSYEEAFLIQKEVITFTSGVPQKVTEISLSPNLIEEFADKATEGIIDGDYDIAILYDYAVYGKVLTGGSSSMPININTFSASTTITGGDDSATIEPAVVVVDQVETYEDYVMSYNEKVVLYGLVDYHLWSQSWFGDLDTAGNFIFVDTCSNIQILNEASDIAFHENVGATEGTCPPGTTYEEINS